MIARLLALFRLVRVPESAPRAKRPASAGRSRRRAARSAVWLGVAAFALLTLGMSAALDTVAGRWRDPEFAVRLDQMRGWREKAPDRPLVVAFGSSRTQMGLSPAAMGFPDAPGSPVVYNFGYRGAHPLGAWLHFTRVLDSGVRPAAVLVQIAPPEVMGRGPAEKQFGVWSPRFTPGDIRRLAPYTKDPLVFRRGWVRGRLNPWATYRAAVLSDLLPDWQTRLQRLDFEWESMDAYGFTPCNSLSIPDELRPDIERDVRRKLARMLEAFEPSTVTDRVFRDLVGRCRAEGIAVAFFWVPESPKFRSWYTPASRAAIEAYGRELAAELGVPVFPAPEHLEEGDFADGLHLLRHGAAKYSRWLADNHLRPWLASMGVGR